MDAEQIFSAILRARGINSVEEWLSFDYQSLSEPKLLPDIEPALKRLKKARKDKEKVGIYGDYDIDGLAATALLLDAFASFNISAEGYIPDRFEEGYGLSKAGIEELAGRGVTLIVSVDCGSTSEAEIKHARSLGVDVIVTDHHEIKEPPPSAIAVINPKRRDSKYPFRDRAGAGVAFALVRALQQEIPGLEEGQEKWLLDLVALATISDVVELIGENRILAGLGLQVINKTRRAGLRALIDVSGSQLGEIDEVDIGYRLGPRLNAAGRLAHAKKSLTLLSTQDELEASSIAGELNELNIERQNEQAKILEQALTQATARADDPVLVLADKGWSHGINGIVAGKLCERLLKPVFIMQTLPDGTTKGSARSSGEFNLADGLSDVRSLLLSGGGHQMAAGATIKTNDLEKLRAGLIASYKKRASGPPTKSRQADVKLSRLEGINLELATKINSLKPFGQGNPEPLLEIAPLSVAEFRAVGAEQKHAKLKLADTQGNTISAIGFSQASAVAELGNSPLSALASVAINDFNGRQTAELVVVKLFDA